MMVWTLFLAAVGFALLVVALITGSVLWAWICIAVCVAGSIVLLASVLWSRPLEGDDDEPGDNFPGEAGHSGRDSGRSATASRSLSASEPPAVADPPIPRYPEESGEITQELGPFPSRAERRRSTRRHRQ